MKKYIVYIILLLSAVNQVTGMRQLARISKLRGMKCLGSSTKQIMPSKQCVRAMSLYEYKERQQRLLSAACCKVTRRFNSEKYKKAGGDYGAFIGDEFRCPCTPPWPKSIPHDEDQLLDDIIDFRTNRRERDTFMHTLPACRMKMLIKYGAPVNERNLESRPIGDASIEDKNLLHLIEKASKLNGDRDVWSGNTCVDYFIDENKNMKVARGVSRELFDSEFHYSYHGLTPLMSAIYQDDFAKFEILLAAMAPEEIQKDLLDLQIIAGWLRYAKLHNKKIKLEREQGVKKASEIDFLQPSQFEIALKPFIKES